MRYIILGLLLTSCVSGESEMIKLLSKVRNENACYTIGPVEYGSSNLGKFVVCTEGEYSRRTE